MTNDQIKYMTNRFLMWRLPDDFAPDNGVSFKGHAQHWPVGTNLLTATQAEAMVRFMVDGMEIPTTKWASPALDRAYREVEKLRDQISQPSESGIDVALRDALDAIETADTEIARVA